MAEIVIGIDLGTTNSCAAYIKDDQVRMIPGRNGESIIPSILSLDEKGNLSIGQQAKRRFVTNPQNTIYGAKRLMGRKFGSQDMDRITNSFFYDVVPNSTGEAIIQVEGREFTLVEISAIILEEIRDQCQEFFEKKIDKAVISVPAYFDNSQREAVRKAGLEAGLDVLRIINEPTAAALAYGFGKRENQKVLVFDLGGGTFDVSVLHLFEDVYEVVATGGDSFLGGIDFDNLLVNYFVERFKSENNIDLSKDKVALQRIRDAAEKLKIDLSATEVGTINLPFITMKDDAPITLAYDLNRQEYNELIEPLAKQTLRITEKVLLEGKVSKEEIDDIILFGGMTRTPMVQDYVQKYFQKKPRRDVHPDEVVAQGAALLADSLASGNQVVVLKDVLPVSIGVGVQGIFRKLINKNTTLPTKLIKSFKTSKKNQTSVKLDIYQGESRECGNNNYLGQLVLDGIPLAEKGGSEILVAFLVDAEGILTIKAKEKTSNSIIESQIRTMDIVQRESYRADKVMGSDTEVETETAGSAKKASPPPAEQSDGGASRNLQPQGFLQKLKAFFSRK